MPCTIKRELAYLQLINGSQERVGITTVWAWFCSICQCNGSESIVIKYQMWPFTCEKWGICSIQPLCFWSISINTAVITFPCLPPSVLNVWYPWGAYHSPSGPCHMQCSTSLFGSRHMKGSSLTSGYSITLLSLKNTCCYLSNCVPLNASNQNYHFYKLSYISFLKGQ